MTTPTNAHFEASANALGFKTVADANYWGNGSDMERIDKIARSMASSEASLLAERDRLRAALIAMDDCVDALCRGDRDHADTVVACRNTQFDFDSEIRAAKGEGTTPRAESAAETVNAELVAAAEGVLGESFNIEYHEGAWEFSRPDLARLYRAVESAKAKEGQP